MKKLKRVIIFTIRSIVRLLPEKIIKSSLYSNGMLNKYLDKKYYLSVDGYCHCCENEVTFTAKNSWLRDSLICSNCKSIPRERALMKTILDNYPNWRNLDIHESSPGGRGASVLLAAECKNYVASQYFPKQNFGEIINAFSNQDLESQTFKNESFDIVVTQDVMEHVYDPEKAFKEIARTLKPGGAHIFSVPIINKFRETEIWAKKGDNGEPMFLHQPEYHGNPVSEKGSPVTMHWGFDIVDKIKKYCGLESEINYIENLDLGISAEFIEIIVTRKG